MVSATWGWAHRGEDERQGGNSSHHTQRVEWQHATLQPLTAEPGITTQGSEVLGEEREKGAGSGSTTTEEETVSDDGSPEWEEHSREEGGGSSERLTGLTTVRERLRVADVEHT